MPDEPKITLTGKLDAEHRWTVHVAGQKMFAETRGNPHQPLARVFEVASRALEMAEQVAA